MNCGKIYFHLEVKLGCSSGELKYILCFNETHGSLELPDEVVKPTLTGEVSLTALSLGEP